MLGVQTVDCIVPLEPPSLVSFKLHFLWRLQWCVSEFSPVGFGDELDQLEPHVFFLMIHSGLPIGQEPPRHLLYEDFCVCVF